MSDASPTPPLPGRTLALSDLHLGRAYSRMQSPEHLRPLVEGFDRVLLLGDIVDHWYCSREQIVHYEARIEEICRESGIREILWFRGNHDAMCERGDEYGLLDEVIYLHGHALFHPLKGSGHVRERIQSMNVRKYGPHRTDTRRGHRGWRLIEKIYVSLPQRVTQPLIWSPHIRHRLNVLVREIAGQRPIRAVVFGHTHCPGVRRVGPLYVVNLGGWMRNTHACAFIRYGALGELRLIHDENGLPRLGRVLKTIPVQG